MTHAATILGLVWHFERRKTGWQVVEWDHLPPRERPTFQTKIQAHKFVREEMTK